MPLNDDVYFTLTLPNSQRWWYCSRLWRSRWYSVLIRKSACAPNQLDAEGAASPAGAIRSTLARLPERSGRLAIFIAPARLMGPAAIDTIVSLRTSKHIVESVSPGGTDVTLVTGDATTFLVAGGLVATTRRPDGNPSGVDERFAGADRASMAANAMLAFEQESPDTLVSQGQWDEEFAYLLEIATRSTTPHLAGSSSFASLPFVYLAGLAGGSSALGEQLFSVADELEAGEPLTSFEIARLALLAVLIVIVMVAGLNVWPN